MEKRNFEPTDIHNIQLAVVQLRLAIMDRELKPFPAKRWGELVRFLGFIMVGRSPHRRGKVPTGVQAATWGDQLRREHEVLQNISEVQDRLQGR